MGRFLPKKLLHSSHLRNTQNDKYLRERMTSGSGQERTESDDVIFKAGDNRWFYNSQRWLYLLFLTTR